MDKKIFWIVLGLLISISLCNVLGSTFGPEPLDELVDYINYSDLIVYGKTLNNEVKWVDDNILTLNNVQIYDNLMKNGSQNLTNDTSIPIYVLGGTIDDPVQAAAHHGIKGSRADWERVVTPNTTLVYFLKKDDNGMYHYVYSENVDTNSEFSRSNLTELKTLISEVMQGIPIPDRTYKPPQKN